MSGFNNPLNGIPGMDLDPGQFLQYLLSQHSEQRKTSDKVQCPQCMKKHRPRDPNGPPQRASHGALEIFVEAACPICLEDVMGPPMIALACGHTLCPADFLKIGGKLNEVQDEDEQSSASEGEGADDGTRLDLMRTLMANGILPTPPGGPPGNPIGADGPFGAETNRNPMTAGGPAGADPFGGRAPWDGAGPNNPFAPRRTYQATNNDDGPRIEELPDEIDEALGVPPMENDSSDNESDDSMPELASRHEDDSSDESDDADDDDDDSMPPLMSRNDQSSDDESDDSMPPLARRRGQADSSSDEDDDDDESLPALEDDEDSDDSMPGLTSREEQDDSSDDSDASMPPLTGRGTRNDDTDDSDDSMSNSSMPGLRTITSSNNRGILNRTSTTAAAASRPTVTDDDDDSSDGTSPPLVKRYDGEDSSDESMHGFKDDSEMSSSDDDRVNRGVASRSAYSQTSGGILILVPVASDKSMVLKKVGRNNYTLPFDESFHDSSKVIPSPYDMLVYSPSQGHGTVKRVTVSTDGRVIVETKFEVPNNAQVVSDGGSAVWALSSSASNQRTKMLQYFGSREVQVRNFSTQSVLYADMAGGGCWVHVKDGNSREKGLWHCYLERQKKVITVNPDVKIAHDSVGGVWVLATDNTLTHVRSNGQIDTYRNAAEVTKETKLVTSTAENGVFVHCRYNQKWDLCHAQASNGLLTLEPLTSCPKDAKIVSDKNGVAWIMQKEKKERKLISVTRDGNVEKHGYQPPPGSIIGGI